VVVTSEGEILIYNGFDPNSSSTWFLVGRFLAGRPVSGTKVLARLGPDLLYLGEDGFQPLSAYLATGESQASRTAISKNIGNAVSQAVAAGSSLEGWGALLYPKGTQIIVNVPQSTTQFYQYVMNTITGAWCRYIGMNAICWEVFNDVPYFGSAAGLVYQFDKDSADGKTPIVATAQNAFNYFGMRGKRKRFTMVRPLITTDHRVTPGVGINIDYATGAPTSSPTFGGLSGALWDSAIWDTAIWPGENTVTTSWETLNGEGFAGSIIVQATTSQTGLANGVLLRLNGFDVAMEPGGLL